MIYLTRTPAPPLSHFVELLWLYDGYTQPHAKERILPSGVMQLVINLRQDLVRVYDRRDTERFETHRGGALLCGAQSEYMVIDTAQQASVMGVHFRPGGAFPFFRPPAGELLDTVAPLDALWPRRAQELREQALEAKSHAERLRILERCLLEQVVHPLERHGAVAFALRQFTAAPHLRSIAEVTGQIGLSSRRFIDVFRDEVGLTPKVFCRIQRFQRALLQADRRRDLNWAEVALDCGYFDQAHFNHDFRAFSGINPSTYLERRTPHRNHVPLE
jgi:AraC-like DNA-binding protein